MHRISYLNFNQVIYKFNSICLISIDIDILNLCIDLDLIFNQFVYTYIDLYIYIHIYIKVHIYIHISIYTYIILRGNLKNPANTRVQNRSEIFKNRNPEIEQSFDPGNSKIW